MVWLSLFACVGPGPSDSGTDSETDTEIVAPMSFTAVGFNVESGGSVVSIVADETVAPVTGESLWGFNEVEDDAAARLLVAAAGDSNDEDFKYVLGTTGWEDRLVLAWDDARFALESSTELDDINVGGTVRAPLVGQMRERESGLKFLFVVNHLWRGDEAKRHEQATLLNEWAQDQSLPIVMVGDYNFDWDLDDNTHDEGYDNLTEDGVFSWVKPDELFRTECSASYNSVLDFTFVAGDAQDWDASAEILQPDDSYCAGFNRDNYSDHRPVAATFTP